MALHQVFHAELLLHLSLLAVICAACVTVFFLGGVAGSSALVLGALPGAVA